MYASVLVVLVLVSQRLFGRVMAPRWRYGLSMLVLLRLLLPVAPESAFSLSNLAPSNKAVPLPVVPAAPVVPIEVMDNHSYRVDVGAFAVDLENMGSTSVEAEVASSAPPAPISATAILSWVWLSGAVLVLLWAGLRHLALMRWLRCVGRPADDNLVALFESCGGRGVALVEVPGLRTAAAVGVFRPRVVLPDEICSALSEDELAHVFAHELAHIRKGDLALNWLVVLAQALHWFNPFAWLGLRRLLAEREIARDAFVVRDEGAAGRSSYGQTLIKVLEAFQPTRLSPGAAPVFTHKPEIRRRIAMIANNRWNSRLAGLFSLILAACLSVGTFTSARADDDDEKKERREHAERENRDREKGDRDRERGEREHRDGEKGDRDRERGEREHRDGEKGDRERDEREHGDRERREREHGEREHADRKDGDRGHEEREHRDRERGEREHRDREGGDREHREREHRDREGGDREHGEREHADRERREREHRERDHEGDRGRRDGEFERHIDELHGAIREAEERGQEDRAHSLKKELKAVTKEREQHRAGAEREKSARREHSERDRDHDEFERKIHQARTRVRELAEVGKIEEAENLEREIEQALSQREEHAERSERERHERSEQEHRERERSVREHRETKHVEREHREREREEGGQADRLERQLHEMAERIQQLERELEKLRHKER